jgi:hypothetical protein
VGQEVLRGEGRAGPPSILTAVAAIEKREAEGTAGGDAAVKGKAAKGAKGKVKGKAGKRSKRGAKRS